MEFTLLFNALLAFGAVFISLRWLGRDPRLAEDAPRAWDVLLGAAIAGLLVGRLTAMIAAGTNPLTHLLDVILIRAGVDTVGATLGFLLALGWAYRDGVVAAADALAAPILFGLAGWHGGCLVRGSCTGTGTSLPWGLPGTADVSRHPVEVYTAVLLLVAAILLARAWRRGVLTGFLGPWALTAAAGSRALTEPLRLHLGSGLLGVYLLGVTLGFGLAYCQRWKHHRPRPQEPGE